MRVIARRPQRKFDADPDVMEVLDGLRWGATSEYVNEAIRRKTNPSVRFHTPSHEDHTIVESLIEAAQEEIIAIGHSLSRLAMTNQGLMRKKIESDRVRLRLVVFNHLLDVNDPAIALLRRELGGQPYVDAIVSEVAESVEFFRELRRLGSESGTHVQLKACSELPSYGVTVFDHQRPNARMLVSIYASRTAGRLHPFLEISPSENSTRALYDVFLEYVHNVLERAKEIPDE